MCVREQLEVALRERRAGCNRLHVQKFRAIRPASQSTRTVACAASRHMQRPVTSTVRQCAMKVLERLSLIDRIGRELQSRMSYPQIDQYLKAHGVDVTKPTSAVN